MASKVAVEDWRAAADRITASRPEVSVCVVPFGVVETKGVSVEVTELARDECARCGQPLPVEDPGPTDVIDGRTGRAEGGWSHQHGCGQWNVPQSIRYTFDLEDVTLEESDGEWEVAVDWEIAEILDGKIAAMVTELDELVDEEREVIREWIVEDLKAQMREELDYLAAGGEDRVVGDPGTPGIFRDTSTGRLKGWAPLYGDPDGVFINEADLA